MCQTCGLASYSYDALPLARADFSTRLIKLHPARAYSADIVVDLVLLSEEPQAGETDFEAVSWCWGRDEWNCAVRIRDDAGDKCFKVSRNLDVALRRLRLVDNYRVLWIDAICIDQRSSVEKSRQVPMMAGIYGMAKRVCVWLGDGDETTRKAIDFMHGELANLNRFDQLCREDEYRDRWMALIQFMEQPWVSKQQLVFDACTRLVPFADHVCVSNSLADDGSFKKLHLQTKKPPSSSVDKTQSSGRHSAWLRCSSTAPCRLAV